MASPAAGVICQMNRSRPVPDEDVVNTVRHTDLDADRAAKDLGCAH